MAALEIEINPAESTRCDGVKDKDNAAFPFDAGDLDAGSSVQSTV